MTLLQRRDINGLLANSNGIKDCSKLKQTRISIFKQRKAAGRNTHVVGDQAITAALGEYGGGDDQTAPLPVALRPPELGPTSPRHLPLQIQRIDNLGKLPPDKLVFIAITMVLDEYLARLLLFRLANQPPRALR